MWNYYEILELNSFGKNIDGKMSNFELTKPLRTYVKKCSKLVPVVEFIDRFINFLI